LGTELNKYSLTKWNDGIMEEWNDGKTLLRVASYELQVAS